jgi:hypothetical protein
MESKDTRYIAKIQVMAAADGLEISAEELQQDRSEEIDRLLKECAEMTEEELMQDVFVQFQFDLYRACQRAYIAHPLGMMKSSL